MIRRHQLSRAFAALAVGGSLFGFATAALPAIAEETAPAAADSAASLSIAPLRVEVDSGDEGATVYLTNASSRELPVQARLFAWTQDGGNDVYAPSSELTVSPSISMIPPGETQIVRLLRKVGAGKGEKRFRLAVDQLPDPSRVQAGQAATRIRFTIPVFVDRDTAGDATLAWKLTDDRLELANTGGATARIVGLAVKTAGGNDVTLGTNTLRYVQGNSTISWPIGKGCSLGPVKITAQVDGQTVDAQPSTTCG
jgi:fimbrial chaperone protein